MPLKLDGMSNSVVVYQDSCDAFLETSERGIEALQDWPKPAEACPERESSPRRRFTSYDSEQCTHHLLQNVLQQWYWCFFKQNWLLGRSKRPFWHCRARSLFFFGNPSEYWGSFDCSTNRGVLVFGTEMLQLIWSPHSVVDTVIQYMYRSRTAFPACWSR